MKHPLGFVLPEGCRNPAACRPDNPVYVRKKVLQRSPRLAVVVDPGEEAQADECTWECAVCGCRVKPQSEGTGTLSSGEKRYLEALARQFRWLDRDQG